MNKIKGSDWLWSDLKSFPLLTAKLQVIAQPPRFRITFRESHTSKHQMDARSSLLPIVLQQTLLQPKQSLV
jgi:hypothetical protein